MFSVSVPPHLRQCHHCSLNHAEKLKPSSLSSPSSKTKTSGTMKKKVPRNYKGGHHHHHRHVFLADHGVDDEDQTPPGFNLGPRGKRVISFLTPSSTITVISKQYY